MRRPQILAGSPVQSRTQPLEGSPSPPSPSATKILGNIHLSYKDNDIPTPGYPWIARTFTRRHIEIENDPRVWNQVEALISSRLPPEQSPATVALIGQPR